MPPQEMRAVATERMSRIKAFMAALGEEVTEELQVFQAAFENPPVEHQIKAAEEFIGRGKKRLFQHDAAISCAKGVVRLEGLASMVSNTQDPYRLAAHAGWQRPIKIPVTVFEGQLRSQNLHSQTVSVADWHFPLTVFADQEAPDPEARFWFPDRRGQCIVGCIGG